MKNAFQRLWRIYFGLFIHTHTLWFERVQGVMGVKSYEGCHKYRVAWCSRSMNEALSVTLKNGNCYKFNTCDWLLAVLCKRIWALTATERAERWRRRRWGDARRPGRSALARPNPGSCVCRLPAPNTTSLARMHAECRTHILLRYFKI